MTKTILILKRVVKTRFFDIIVAAFAALAQPVEQHFRKVKVPSANLGGGSINCGIRIVAVRDLPKVKAPVRFWYPAPESNSVR